MLSTGDADERRAANDGRRTSAARFRRRRIGLAAVIAMLLAGTLAVVEGATSSAVHAATTDTLTLGENIHVVDTDTGLPLDPTVGFKFIINVDNTGTTEQRSPSDGCSPETAGYPDTCHWTSMGIDSQSPIFTQGDRADFAAGLGHPRRSLPDLGAGGRLQARRAHFTMPLDTTDQVDVESRRRRLPDATIQAAVFEDISPVNGAPDLPAEHGLAGFTRPRQGHARRAQHRRVRQSRLCGTGVCLSYCYVVDNGDRHRRRRADRRRRSVPERPDRAEHGTRLALDSVPADRSRAPAATTRFPSRRRPRSRARSRSRTSGRTATRCSVTPPDGTTFIQTTTLEGNHDWDAWVMEGATGLDTEFVVSGEPFPAIIFGYVPPSDSLNGAGDRRSQGRRRGLQGRTSPPRAGSDRRRADDRRQDRQADRQRMGLALRSRQRRHRRLDGTGGRERCIRHPQRARWQLHDQLVGRAAGLHTRPPERHGQRR